MIDVFRFGVSVIVIIINYMKEWNNVFTKADQISYKTKILHNCQTWKWTKMRIQVNNGIQVLCDFNTNSLVTGLKTQQFDTTYVFNGFWALNVYKVCPTYCVTKSNWNPWINKRLWLMLMLLAVMAAAVVVAAAAVVVVAVVLWHDRRHTWISLIDYRIKYMMKTIVVIFYHSPILRHQREAYIWYQNKACLVQDVFHVWER